MMAEIACNNAAIRVLKPMITDSVIQNATIFNATTMRMNARTAIAATLNY